MTKTKKRPAPSIEHLRAAALVGAKCSGCTCQPHITFREPALGLLTADVAHDPGCRLPSRRRGGDA